VHLNKEYMFVLQHIAHYLPLAMQEAKAQAKG
jgi:hypothetical protein